MGWKIKYVAKYFLVTFIVIFFKDKDHFKILQNYFLNFQVNEIIL